jgi:UDP-2,3-diacylglucosamine hydrolase
VPANAKGAQAETLALFVSDLHLQAGMPRTTQAFLAFLKQQAPRAERLFLLGDIFEYWAGDDDLGSPWLQPIIAALHGVSASGTALFWIAGNRDFLAGERFAAATGATLLPDPYVTTLAGRKLVLAHGDAQCTGDQPYMAFRAQVRQPEWQAQFLARPLAERKALIEAMREQSRAAQRGKDYQLTDVDPGAIEALLRDSGAESMIHGHTHRPGRHEFAVDGLKRLRCVLPDWDCDQAPMRGGWIELGRDGALRMVGLEGLGDAGWQK